MNSKGEEKSDIGPGRGWISNSSVGVRSQDDVDLGRKKKSSVRKDKEELGTPREKIDVEDLLDFKSEGGFFRLCSL